MLIVNPDLPVHSVQELIAYAKANPGKLSYGSGGVGAPHHLYAELFKSMTGIKMTHVPYKGSVPALNDVVAGHIQLMFCDIPPAAGMVAAGKVRALGVSTSARVAAFPDIPPINEAGVPGFDVAGWFMIVAPAKTPRAGRRQAARRIAKAVMATPDIKEQHRQAQPVADADAIGRRDARLRQNRRSCAGARSCSRPGSPERNSGRFSSAAQ